MKAMELNEDIVDDILADFPQFKSRGDAPPRPKFTPQPSSARQPVKVRGIDHNSFSQWLRSKEQVRKAIQENLDTPKITLKNCIALYTEYNIKIDDFVILEFPIEAVYPYREYDRDMKDGWTGKMRQEEYTELMKNISTIGISNPGILEISANGADYEVQLGEGNHRLRIAKELGIEKYPVSFAYKFG